MASLMIDSDSVAATGARLLAAGEVASTPANALLAPVAADPVSLAVAATLQARAAGIDAYSAAAAAITAARGQQLDASAASYAEQEALNTASLGAGGGTGGTAAAPAAPAPIALPALPPVSAPAIGAPPGQGKEIAELIHAGPGTGALYTAAQRLQGHAALLRTVGDHLITSSSDVAADWSSESGELASRRIAQLGGWYYQHADHVEAAATAVMVHAESFDRAKANIPTPAQFADVESRLRQAAAANANPANMGRYAPVVTALQTQLSTMNTQALTQYASYGGHAQGPVITGDPLVPLPKPGGAAGPQPGVAAGPDDQIVGPPAEGPQIQMVDSEQGPPLPPPGAQPQIGPFPVPPSVAAHAPPGPPDPTGGLLTPENLPPVSPPPAIPGISPAAPSAPGPSPATAPPASGPSGPGCGIEDWSKGVAEVVAGPVAILTAAPEGATGVGIPLALSQIALGFASTVDGVQIINRCTS